MIIDKRLVFEVRGLRQGHGTFWQQKPHNSVIRSYQLQNLVGILYICIMCIGADTVLKLGAHAGKFFCVPVPQICVVPPIPGAQRGHTTVEKPTL